eukprot:382018-Pyramimonas_sp.AAC.1
MRQLVLLRSSTQLGSAPFATCAHRWRPARQQNMPPLLTRSVHVNRICPLPSHDWSTSTEYAPSPRPIGPPQREPATLSERYTERREPDEL